MATALLNNQTARRSAILEHVSMGETRWSRAILPTLADLSPLTNLVTPALLHAVIEQPLGPTVFETARGHPISLQLESNTSAIDAAAAFDRLIAPAAQTPGTRSNYYASWRTFVTFALSVDALHEVMPASSVLIKAFLLALISVNAKAGTILVTLAAITSRHRQYGHAMSVPPSMISAWCKAVKRCIGMPAHEKYRILPCHIKLVLALPSASLADDRNVAILVNGTICSMRAGEIPDLDVCDAIFEIDGEGTLALRIKWRKNDIFRRGLWPRIGKSKNSSFCPIRRLRDYMQRAGLHISSGCTKATLPASPCYACGRLFPATTAYGKRFRLPHELGHTLSRAQVASAVRSVLLRIGVVPEGYGGPSMRKGGVSAAVCAGVPADLRLLQTGHRSNAWTHYGQLTLRTELYRCSDAFGL